MVMNKALKHFDSSFVIPLLQVSTLIHSILSGGIFLNEFDDYSEKKLEFGLFLGGVSFLLAGIMVLLLSKEKPLENKDEE